jgi:hypothetical protein
MRKKIYILLILLFVSISGVYSQDRIISVNGDTVYAKIMEVSDKTVSYKRYAYQDGATFILDINKIKRIIWANGEIDVYDPEKNTLTSAAAKEEPLPRIVEIMRSDFLLDNGTEMDEDKFEYLLMTNDLERYWETYKSGKRLFKTGRGLLIGGGGGIVGGAIIIGLSYAAGGSGSELDAIVMAPILVMGIGVAVAGAVVFSVGIPLTITGSVKRTVFMNIYNEDCAGKYPSEISATVLNWKLSPSVGGLNFTLNF